MTKYHKPRFPYKGREVICRICGQPFIEEVYGQLRCQACIALDSKKPNINCCAICGRHSTCLWLSHDGVTRICSYCYHRESEARKPSRKRPKIPPNYFGDQEVKRVIPSGVDA